VGLSNERHKQGEPRRVRTDYRHSTSFPVTLAETGCALLVSTYQAGQLVAIGQHEAEMVFSFHSIGQAMGIAVDHDQIAVGARGQVWFLDENPDLAPLIEPKGRYDRCYLPRRSEITGSIQCHEVTWGKEQGGKPDLWLVNTLYSCLAGLHPKYSFVPRWRPPFVTEIAGEDRCHLNGLAMRDGTPAYVTVMAQSNEPGGWRADRNTTGAILDIASGQPVTTGLSMPHSPRWHQGRLFALNSGMGRLEHVNLADGSRDIVALFPGYARGLAFHGNLAFVGLSRIRETAIFGGVPVANYHDQLKCGVGVIDLTTGATIATLEFTSGIEEIFDVQVVPDTGAVYLAAPPDSPDQTLVVPRWAASPDIAGGDVDSPRRPQTAT